ncbi:hypothetical protein [Cupriavidus metallidurans]|uniref:hypothetical protein n=1 Tax=Cupriavidus metallidurans TaxID=119219 RepID=UPI000CDFF690|nr:hypothetical protein [Cupriavidus metallidurans]AVA38258.1 hypothetical protein C3Z06_32145 [Cupriavidus metallidurans]
MNTNATPGTMNVPVDLIRQLHAIGTGECRHLRQGSCPDAVEGPDARDDECPACQALKAIDALLPPMSAHEMWYGSVQADLRSQAQKPKWLK